MKKNGGWLAHVGPDFQAYPVGEVFMSFVFEKVGWFEPGTGYLQGDVGRFTDSALKGFPELIGAGAYNRQHENMKQPRDEERIFLFHN